MTLSHSDFRSILETSFDWNMIFGVVRDAYSDPGFTSNSDNFLRAKVLELAIECFSDVRYIDENGCDFVLEKNGEITRIEAKFLKKFFKKNGTCKSVKIKNYRGDVSNVAFSKYSKEDKYDYLMIVDTVNYAVAIIDRNTAQKYYVSSGDGINGEFPKEKLTILNLNPQNFTLPVNTDLLSTVIKRSMIDWIRNR